MVAYCFSFQALKTEMVQFLVRLLTTGLESQENVAATKAQVVKALKAMQCSLKFGDAVGSCLYLAISFIKSSTFIRVVAWMAILLNSC